MDILENVMKGGGIVCYEAVYLLDEYEDTSNNRKLIFLHFRFSFRLFYSFKDQDQKELRF